jgi:hypothetical protein
LNEAKAKGLGQHPDSLRTSIRGPTFLPQRGLLGDMRLAVGFLIRKSGLFELKTKKEVLLGVAS